VRFWQEHFGDSDDQVVEEVQPAHVDEGILEEVGAINEDPVDPDQRHVATKNLKRKRVNGFGPGSEPVE
jgi:hypothetical protein